MREKLNYICTQMRKTKGICTFNNKKKRKKNEQFRIDLIYF